MKNILIIYDPAVVHEILAEELLADGHLVIPIEKLRLAKELIKTVKPDLVLLNVPINGEEKWGVLEKIKANNRNLPVLVFTDEQDLHDKLTDVYAIESVRFGFRKRSDRNFQHEANSILNRQP